MLQQRRIISQSTTQDSVNDFACNKHVNRCQYKKIEQPAINTYMLKLYPDKEKLSMSWLLMSPVSTIVVSIYLI